MDYLSREHRFEHLDRRGNSEQRRTYTIVINRGGKKTLIAIVKGVSADKVTEVIMRIEEQRRGVVRGYNDGYFQFHASNSQELFPQCYASLSASTYQVSR